MAAEYRLEIINNQTKLENLTKHLASVSVMALDIETIEWWNRQREQIALIQLAFRHQGQIKVAVIDTLAKIELAPMKSILASLCLCCENGDRARLFIEILEKCQ